MRKKERETLAKSFLSKSYEFTSQSKLTQLANMIANDLNRKYSHSSECFLLSINRCPYFQQCYYTGKESCPYGNIDIRTNNQYYNSNEYDVLNKTKSIIEPYL